MLQRTGYEEIPDFNGRYQRVENCRIMLGDSRKNQLQVFFGQRYLDSQAFLGKFEDNCESR
jgi:hypothetical protein